MNCSRCETLLSDYMEEALPSPVRLAVQEHLDSCPDCRELLEEVRQLRSELADFPPAAPPEGMVESILLQTVGPPKSRSLWRDIFSPTLLPFLTPRFAFATGIMFVFLSLMVNVLGPGFSGRSSDLSASTLAEGGARVANQVSKRWEQFRDFRARAWEELSLWAEDVTGRLDYHLITGLFRNYQEAVEDQKRKLEEPEQGEERSDSAEETEPPEG